MENPCNKANGHEETLGGGFRERVNLIHQLKRKRKKEDLVQNKREIRKAEEGERERGEKRRKVR